MAFHAVDSRARRSTSSVASGRAKKRNGTKVVPSPGETCSHRRAVAVDARRVSARADARAAASRPGTGARSGRRACGRRGRGGTRPAERSSDAPGSGRAGCGGRRPESASRLRRSPRPASAGRRPRAATGAPRRSISTPSSASSVAGSSAPRLDRLRERVAADREVVVAEHDVRRAEPASSSERSARSPRGRESRSPVTQTRSGCRAATQSTARSTRDARRARARRGGSPRGARSAGRRAPAAGPASRHLERRAAAPSPPRTSPQASQAAARRRRRHSACRTPAARTSARCELLEHRPRPETTWRLNFSSDSSKPAATPISCDEVQDRHLEVLAGRRLQLRLPRVEREVAERARRHHRVGARLDRLLDRLDQLAERRLLAGLDDREAAALDLRRVVDRLAAAGLDDPLERPRPVGVLEARAASTGAGSGSRRTARPSGP